MLFLANENFPGEAVEALRREGHDVAWVRIDAPGISDEEVLKRAQIDNRVVLTFDKDFGELALRAGLPAACGVIRSGYQCLQPARLLESQWLPYRAVRIGRATFL